VHSWRVQLPDRRWVSLGRTDEVSLADARAAAQTLRAQAALGQVATIRPDQAKTTLGDFLTETYSPWMRATYKGRARQVDRVRAAFADLLEVPLNGITAAKVDRWRADRRNRRGTAKRNVTGSTINRDLAALQAAISKAVEWGQLATNPPAE
jgi:hypothetical protein